MPKLTTTKVQSQAKFRPFLTIFTLMFATVSIFSSFNLVNVQAGNGGNLNLKIKSKTSTDGVNFGNETVSNSDQWASYNAPFRTFRDNYNAYYESERVKQNSNILPFRKWKFKENTQRRNRLINQNISLTIQIEK